MPTKNGNSLANRLAAVASKHSKAAVANRSRMNLAAKLAALRPSGPAVYQNMNTKKNKVNKVNCGAKPSKIWKNGKTKTNEFLKWNACTKAAAAAGGGKRKTRRGKKSKRMTRRR